MVTEAGVGGTKTREISAAGAEEWRYVCDEELRQEWGGGGFMVTAADLKEGMALRIEKEIFRVTEVEARAGAAKMGGTVRARLENARTGRLWDQHFRPQERLDDLEVEQHKLEFLYGDENVCTFLRMDTYEQAEFPAAALGEAAKLLPSGTEVTGDFFEGRPISVHLPQTVEARVVTTAPASRAAQDSSRKEAKLENGLTIQVPLFVGPGETVSIDLRTGKYVERVRAQHKKGA